MYDRHTYEALTNARLISNNNSYLSDDSIKAAASLLHEDWKSDYLDITVSDKICYTPCMKETIDTDWIDEHGGVDTIDAANTSFDDLPDDIQDDFRDPAVNALLYIFETGLENISYTDAQKAKNIDPGVLHIISDYVAEFLEKQEQIELESDPVDMFADFVYDIDDDNEIEAEPESEIESKPVIDLVEEKKPVIVEHVSNLHDMVMPALNLNVKKPEIAPKSVKSPDYTDIDAMLSTLYSNAYSSRESASAAMNKQQYLNDKRNADIGSGTSNALRMMQRSMQEINAKYASKYVDDKDFYAAEEEKPSEEIILERKDSEPTLDDNDDLMLLDLMDDYNSDEDNDDDGDGGEYEYNTYYDI